MDAIFRIEHIYGQEIARFDEMNELIAHVEILADSSLGKAYFENGTRLEIADAELKVLETKISVEDSQLIVTIHVEG